MPLEQPFIYGEYFNPVTISPLNPVIYDANKYLVDRKIGHHPFFQAASESPKLLRLWTTQELVITNEFAKQLHLLAGRINNTNLRAIIDVVIAGENGEVSSDGVARNSHPTLLDQLRESLAITPPEVKPLSETVDFLSTLEDLCKSPLRGVAAVGVGSERMILEEYGSLLKAFEDCLPDANYRSFLLANISEDSAHASLLAQVGTGLINQGHNPIDYWIGAKLAVDSRFTYYDQLLRRA